MEIPRLNPTGSVTAAAVNGQGVVVGQIETSTAPQAWMYQQGSGALNALSLDPTQTGGTANGITDGGVIAGDGVISGATLPGFWTVTGGAMVLAGADATQAVAANDNGTLVGYYANSGTVSSAALSWTAPGYAQTQLPQLRCDQCTRLYAQASGINAGGLIVGSSSYGIYDGSGNFVAAGLHAVEWRDGTVADLGALQGATASAAYGVNDSGDVVGSSRASQASGAATHAFLYHAGTMADLGTLSGDSDSSAQSINDAGQIVGQSSSGSMSRAFLYENGRMYDLATLIDPASALAGVVSLTDAVSIGSNGWIAANGTDSRDPGWTRAFLLIPAQ